MNKLLLKIFSYLIITFSIFSIISTAHSQDTLRIISMSDPKSLDPQLANSSWETLINQDTFENLVSLDAKGELTPGLAESWTSNEDATVWTIKLRKAQWSDGVPITADDILFSFRRVLSPTLASKYASMMFPIKNAYNFNKGKVSAKELGVKKVDDYTVQFTMEASTPYLPGLLNHSTGAIVPKHTIEKFGNRWARTENIVVGGAYKPIKWEKNSKIVLKKNPKYYDHDKVHIENVQILIQEDGSSAVKRFIADEADILYEFPQQQYNYLKTKAPESIRLYPYMGVFYYSVNTRKEPFSNKDIRQALGMAIDRTYIVNKITNGLAQPAYSWVPPGVQGMTKNAVPYWEAWSFEKRLATAKEIFKKHGYSPEKPLELTIRFDNSLELHKRIAIAIAEYWKKIGVTTKLLSTDANTHYDEVEKGNFDIARASWKADYNDPFDFLMLPDKVYGGLNNFAKYDSEPFHQYILQSGQTVDYNKRGEIFYKAEEILMEDMPVIPVLFFVSVNLVKPYVKGFVNNTINLHKIKYMTIEK